MAEVLLAKTRGPSGFERLVALKRILPERAKDPDSVRMLLDEARNAAGLVHHRIVQVLDVEVQDGSVVLAMEYLHGQSLASVIDRAGRIPLAQALAICIAVADGLHYAHERSIVHRDVAPPNVMVCYDGNVKLIDFGIAKAANNLSNTVYGTFKGRLGYSSPEQCRCEQVDRRTDVYSLSILLYELTTGRHALVADNEEDMLARMTAGAVTPPRSVDPTYPPELEAIVLKGLAVARDQRYPTAAALQHDLEAFAANAGANISDVALSRYISELFASEVAPWNQARETGMTLADFLLDTLENKPTLEHAPRKKRRRRKPRWGIRIAVVIALVACAYAFTRWVLAEPELTAPRSSG